MLYSFHDISCLPLTQEHLAVLRRDGYERIGDLQFLRFSPLKRLGSLTNADWRNLLRVLLENGFGDGLDDILTQYTYSCGLRRCPGKCKGITMDVYILCVMGEKYVVATARAGKRLSAARMYRCIANGVVFLDEDEALAFAGTLIRYPRCRELRKTEITSAADTLYLTRLQDRNRHYFLFRPGSWNDSDESVMAMVSDAPFYVTSLQKARALAGEFVRQINYAFDYEIAQPLEYTLTPERTVQPMQESEESFCFVKREPYIEALERESAAAEGEFFAVHGQKHGFVFARGADMACLRQEIRRTEQFLQCLQELPPPLREADEAYYGGYRDALLRAASLQPAFAADSMQLSVLAYTEVDTGCEMWEGDHILSSQRLHANVRKELLPMHIRIRFFGDWEEMLAQVQPGELLFYFHPAGDTSTGVEKRKEVYERFGAELNLLSPGADLFHVLEKAVLPGEYTGAIASAWLRESPSFAEPEDGAEDTGDEIGGWDDGDADE